MSKPECLHDCDRLNRAESFADRVITHAHCQECGVLLYVMDHNIATNKIATTYHDSTYELLYTRKGRLELVKEALTARGWPIPEHWRRRTHTTTD